MGDEAVTFDHFLVWISCFFYDKWTFETEDNVIDLCVVNGSSLQFQTFIYHYQQDIQ